MKIRNIITLIELQNFGIKDEITTWDKYLSFKEKMKSNAIISNKEIDDLKIIKSKKKFSLTNKILIFVLPLIIISAGIIIFKYLFHDKNNKTNFQINIDPDMHSLLNQTNKKIIDSDSNYSEEEYLWRNIQDKEDSKKDNISEQKQKNFSPNTNQEKNKKSTPSSLPIPNSEQYYPEKYYDWREKSGYSDKEYRHQDFPWEKYSSNMQIKDVDTTNSDPLLKKQIGFDHVSDENSLFDKTYYFIDTAQCSRKVNGEKVYASLKQLADSVKKASAMGITDIVFPQSSFDISEQNTINQLHELLEEAELNKITLNLFLDMQFSTPQRVKHLLPEYFYKKTSSGNYSIYQGRYIHDQTNEISEKYISNYINKLASIGINNFILGELPKDILSDYTGELYISPFINIVKFKERFNSIKNSSPNINLLFSYSNKIEEDEIKSMNLQFSGAIFRIQNSDSLKLKSDENFIAEIFQEEENKLLMLDFELAGMVKFSMRFLLGLYLFSPIPIILNIRDDNFCPYSINILCEELLSSEEIKLNKKFIEIIKVKRFDTYFAKPSLSLVKTFYYERVIMATREKYSHSITYEKLIYIFNLNFSYKFIPMDQIFSTKYPFMYQVIYDSKELSNNGTILQSSGFRLTGRQLLIIKVVK